MKTLDVIVLSNTSNDSIYEMNCNCFKSLLESETNALIRIILIESNKNSTYSYNFNNLEVIIPDESFHFHRFINKGISHCNADYIAVCNNDLIFHKNWFSEIVKIAEQHTDILSFSPIDYKYMYMSKLAKTNKDFYIGWEIMKYIAGWCIVLKKELLDIVQPFDERYGFYFSDTDYGFTLNRNNVKHALITKSYVEHLESVNTKKIINNKSSVDSFFSFQEFHNTSLPKCLSKKRYGFVFENERMIKDFLVFHEKWGEPFYLLKVSILIVIHDNLEADVKNTIISALSQTYEYKEIIIVDCSSNDELHKIVLSFESDTVKIYRLNSNNLSISWNYALSKSTGHLIQFLKPGDIISGNKIEEQIADFYYVCDNYAAICCQHLLYTDTVDNSIYNPEKPTANFHYTKNTVEVIDDYSKGKYNFYLSSFLFHRDLIDKAGRWNEELLYFNVEEYLIRTILNANSVYYSHVGMLYNKVYNENCQEENVLQSKLLSIKYIVNNILATNNKNSKKIAANIYKKYIDCFKADENTYSEIEKQVKHLGYNLNESFSEKVLRKLKDKWLDFNKK